MRKEPSTEAKFAFIFGLAMLSVMLCWFPVEPVSAGGPSPQYPTEAELTADLALKANKASPTLTGQLTAANASFTGDVWSAGNVGAGGTAKPGSLWANTYVVAASNEGIIQGGDQSNVGFHFAGNAYFASDGNWKYVAADEAGDFYINNGVFVFRNVTSGSAGGNITWAEAMRIDVSGNVGINGAASGSSKLEVDGNIYCTADISGLSITDRSDSPESLDLAYAIVQSHETTESGTVDHTKLHRAAWGGGDQSKRNMSMVLSAQAMVIKDLIRRLEQLEK